MRRLIYALLLAWILAGCLGRGDIYVTVQAQTATGQPLTIPDDVDSLSVAVSRATTPASLLTSQTSTDFSRGRENFPVYLTLVVDDTKLREVLVDVTLLRQGATVGASEALVHITPERTSEVTLLVVP